ncbi:MAG: hypothetical protein ACYS9X_24945 [Planctomycetota bacterium]|jgi:hypothetical protein
MSWRFWSLIVPLLVCVVGGNLLTEIAYRYARHRGIPCRDKRWNWDNYGFWRGVWRESRARKIVALQVMTGVAVLMHTVLIVAAALFMLLYGVIGDW